MLNRALANGDLVRVLPEMYLLPDVSEDRGAVLRAAVAYAGVPAAASHLTAVELWRLPVPSGSRIHLMTGPTRHPRGAANVLVHRRRGFLASPPHVIVRQGVSVTRLETSIVDSWPLLDGDAKRAPVIFAVAERLTTAERLRQALDSQPRLGGRRHLAALIAKLADGCRSPLELWGYDNVLNAPGMPRFRWQAPVALGNRVVYLDAYDEASGVNVELDGAKYHRGPADRERDLRRDSGLAALGITVVRFTHARLMREVDEVRREILAIIASRRRD